MKIKDFLSRIERGTPVSFTDTIHVIDEHYAYRPVRFSNGRNGDQVINPAGSNQGSCKIFAFAKLHRLTETDTLALFGDYYWHDVLEHPDGVNHANIRAFIRYGWTEVHFSGDALSPRKDPRHR